LPCAAALAQSPTIAPEAAPAATAAPPSPASNPAPSAPEKAAKPDPTPEQRDGARAAYGRGQALFTEGKYVEAKSAFAEAYAAVPNPIVLLGSAECALRLGLLEDAYGLLQDYLSKRPDAPDRASVEQKLADLLAMQATVVITSQPAGAAIKLDGQDTGKVTPAELQLVRGEHTLEFSREGYQKASDTLTARIGARHELDVALQPTPPPRPPSIVKEASAPEAMEHPTTALWITGAVGAAGLVTGTVLGFLVLAERSDFDAKPSAAVADRGERLALFADVAFGVGAMALITGAVLYVTSDDAGSEPAPQHAQAERLKLAPAVFAGGGGVFAHMHF
jgi:tetratricopeptide (TPR) repeat protein